MAKHVSPDDERRRVIEVSLSDEDPIDDDIYVAPSTEALARDWAEAIRQDPSLMAGDRLEQAAEYRRWAADRGAVDPPSFADIRLSLGYSNAGFAGSTQLSGLDGHRTGSIKLRPVRNFPDSSAVTTPGVPPCSELTRAGGSGGSCKWGRKNAANDTLRLEERQLWKNDWKKKQDVEEQVRAKRQEVENHHKQEEERRRRAVRRMQANVQRLYEEEQLRKHKRDGDSLLRKKQDLEEDRKRRKKDDDDRCKDDDDRCRSLEYADSHKRQEGSEWLQQIEESYSRRQKERDRRLQSEQHERLTKITAPAHQDADWMHQQSVPFDIADKLDYRSLLERLYKEHNPAKLTQVNQLLVKYAGQEAEMYAHICNKYGVSPLKYVPSVSKKRGLTNATVVPSSSRACRGGSNRDLDHTLSPDTVEQADKDLWHRFQVLQKLSRQKDMNSNLCNPTTTPDVANVGFASASVADSDEVPPLENELWGRFQNLLNR